MPQEQEGEFLFPPLSVGLVDHVLAPPAHPCLYPGVRGPEHLGLLIVCHE